MLSEPKLFPADMLKDIDGVIYQSLQTRAILKATRSDNTGSSVRKSFEQRPGYAYNHFLPQHQQRRDSSNYNRYHSLIKSRIPVLSRLPTGTRALVQVQGRSVGADLESEEKGAESPRVREVNMLSFECEAQQLATQAKIPVGGRLRFFWKAWRTISASNRIARWLNRGYRLPEKA